MFFDVIEQFWELKAREIPQQLNFFVRKSDKFSFLVRLGEGNRTEDNEVVVNVEIGRGLVFEQSFVVRVHVEKFAVDFNFGAGNELAVKNLVQVMENVVGRDVSDVGRNGIGYGVVFESEKSKRRAGSHQLSPLCFEILVVERKGNFHERHNNPDIFCFPNVRGKNRRAEEFST